FPCKIRSKPLLRRKPAVGSMDAASGSDACILMSSRPVPSGVAMTFRSLVWLRDDLRLADNPALNVAVAQGGRVAALTMLAQAPGLRPLGGAVSWWLGKSLASVGRSLDAAGIELQVQTGDPRQIVPAVAQRLGVTNVLWNRRYA